MSEKPTHEQVIDDFQQGRLDTTDFAVEENDHFHKVIDRLYRFQKREV